MLNDKQVSLWVGTDEPPTKFHIWIYNYTEVRYYDGTKWVAFIGDIDIATTVSSLVTLVDKLDAVTINGKNILTNPVLDAGDINIKTTGTYVSGTVDNSINTLDGLLKTTVL